MSNITLQPLHPLEAGRAPEPVWTLWRSTFASVGIGTSYPPARSVVATTTDLSLFLLFDSRYVNVCACVRATACAVWILGGQNSLVVHGCRIAGFAVFFSIFAHNPGNEVIS